MAAEKAMKSIPSSENGSGTLCFTKSRREFPITQCREKQRFTLWEHVPEGYKKIATAQNSPMELYDKVPWDK